MCFVFAAVLVTWGVWNYNSLSLPPARTEDELEEEIQVRAFASLEAGPT